MSLLRFEEQIDTLEQNDARDKKVNSQIESDCILNEERVWEQLWDQMMLCSSVNLDDVVAEQQRCGSNHVTTANVMNISPKMHSLLHQRQLSDGSSISDKFGQMELLQWYQYELTDGVIDVWKEAIFAYMNNTFKSQKLPQLGLQSLHILHITAHAFLYGPRMKRSLELQCLLDSLKSDSIENVTVQRSVLENRVVAMHSLYVELLRWVREQQAGILSQLDFTSFFDGTGVTDTWAVTWATEEWIFFPRFAFNLTTYLVNKVKELVKVSVEERSNTWGDVLDWLDASPYKRYLTKPMVESVFRATAESVVDGAIDAIGSLTGFEHCDSALLRDIFFSSLIFPTITQKLSIQTLEWFTKVSGSWDMPLCSLLDASRDMLNCLLVFDTGTVRACIMRLRDSIPAYRDGMDVLATHIQDVQWLDNQLDPEVLSLNACFQLIFQCIADCKCADDVLQCNIEETMQYKALDMLNQRVLLLLYSVVTRSFAKSTIASTQQLALQPGDLRPYLGRQKFVVTGPSDGQIVSHDHVLHYLPAQADQADVLGTLPDDEKVCVPISAANWVPDAIVRRSYVNSNNYSSTIRSPHRAMVPKTVLEPVPKTVAGVQLNKVQKLRDTLVNADVLPLLRQPVLFLAYLAGDTTLLADAMVRTLTQQAQSHIFRDETAVTAILAHITTRIGSIIGEGVISPALVVLNDVLRSKTMHSAVSTRSKEDQQAQTQFHQFKLSSSGTTGKNNTANFTAPNLFLAKQPELLHVLLISSEMWVSEWQRYMLGQNVDFQKSHLDLVLQRTIHTKAAFMALPTQNTLLVSSDIDVGQAEISELKKRPYDASTQPLDHLGKANISAHMNYDAAAIKGSGTVFSVQGATLRLPRCIANAVQEYTQIYNSIAKPRTLTFFLTEGLVSLDIEINGVVKTFHTTPVCATVVSCFGDEQGLVSPQLSVSQVAQITLIGPDLTRDAIRFWCIHGVLQYVGNSLYQATG